jgi:hypothetical protein
MQQSRRVADRILLEEARNMCLHRRHGGVIARLSRIKGEEQRYASCVDFVRIREALEHLVHQVQALWISSHQEL